MGISSIQHNMLMVNADRRMRENAKVKTKTAEKLASGYRINRAADDAAGLSMSEKMRYMIRGLNQGTENAMDGISWVQIGDGSLEEAHSMLHRMTELAIKSSNGTNTDDDRAMMQAEFAHLQKEIDRLTDNTTFNEQHIFQEHEWPYHQIEGSTYWSPTECHTVREEDNDLVIVYGKNVGDPLEKVSIKVAAGKYTTKELVDEIDTQLEKAGLLEKGIHFNYNDRGFCDLSLEGGRVVDEVSGGLSYLLYDNFAGGTLGALIGTTAFPDDTSPILLVKDKENSQMTFQLLNPEDLTDKINVEINLLEDPQPGSMYSKKTLIDIINRQIQAAIDDHEKLTGKPGGKAEATSEGEIIKISSLDYIVSEFEGNMFKIDGGIYSSVFYDNIKYSDNVLRFPAELQGGYVVRDAAYNKADPEGSVFHFSAGDRLVMNPNGRGQLVIDMEPMNHKTIDDVIDYLQKQFDEFEYTDEDGTKQKGAGLVVSKLPGVTSWIHNNPNDYSYQTSTRLTGLKITSTVEGPGSTLGIDKKKSTAYAPLFTSQRVTAYRRNAEFGENDGTVNTNDYLIGLRTLGSMTIEDGKNDSFEIRLGTGNWETIKLKAGTYGSAALLAEQIQEQMDTVLGKDKVKVTATNTTTANRIRIEAGSSDVKGIAVKTHEEADGTKNTGYRDIFQGRIDTPEYADAPSAHQATTLLPEIKTLDANGKITISAAEGNLAITVNGKERAVNLAGTWTLDEIKQKIKAAFPTMDEPYQFDAINASGSTYTRTVTASSNTGGHTSSNAATYSAYGLQTGFTEPNEGDPARPIQNRGAALTFAGKLPSQIKITKANKDFNFKLNGDEVKIDLVKAWGEGKTFNSPADFASALQSVIKDELKKEPDQYGGVKVGFDSKGYLQLTAGLDLGGGAQYVGQQTTLQMMVNDKGGFVYNLHDTSTSATAALTAKQTPSSGSSTVSVNQNFTGSATVNLILTNPDGTKTNIDFSVDGGNLETNLNKKLEGKNIRASVSSTGVTFSTTGEWKADGYKLEIDTGAGKTTLQEKLFAFSNGTMEHKTGASATTSLAVKAGPIVFSEDQSFSMTVDNVTKDVTIKKGTYNINSQPLLKKAIQDGLDAAFGTEKVTVNVSSSGYLTFTTKSTNGANSNIKLNYQEKYNSKQSALRTMFGAREIGGVEASFDEVGGDPNKVQLRLTRIPYDAANPNDKGAISVTSNYVDKYGNSTYKGGSFIYPKTTYKDPTPAAGYHSQQNSYMQGVALKTTNGVVEIDEYNKHLSFYYSDNYGSAGNVPKHIEFDLAEDKYKPADLVKALQEKIDQEPAAGGIGPDKLKVLIEKGGIRIETVEDNAGSKYRIHTNSEGTYAPTGSFYEKILCGSGLSKTYTKPLKDEEGKQSGGRVYAMGRQDVKNQITKIQKDGNDTLSLKFKTPDKPDGIALEMTLDAGYYNSDQLVKQIQGKLDQALEKAGLKKGLIEAVVGYKDPDSKPIYGAIDDRALAFKLSDTVAVPKDGKYAIEAIGGTAAFSVFYATDGDIARAYVKGGKDITNGAVIRSESNTLSVEVDGKPYEITLEPGKYTTQKLLEHMNEKFEDGEVPLRAYEDGGRLKLMHSKYGKHSIKHLGGGIKNDLFYRESGEWSGNQPMRLRVSGVSGDWIEVDKPWMDTSSLGINTLTIEKYENAQKAITRLKSAVTKVSNVRSYFGALQNRLESTVRNNQNKAENTTAAESRIRDADFSKEAMENSLHNILEQAGVSVMTQIMQNSNLALQLLS